MTWLTGKRPGLTCCGPREVPDPQIDATSTHERNPTMNAVVDDTVQALKTNLNGARNAVQSSARDASEATLRQVREHPFMTLAIAALTGTVLGVLIRKRG
jgi:ElaB/YqjD/DUF883 family membrane-anchored ribosome-binding protein